MAHAARIMPIFLIIVFCTKILVALLLELPYDIWVLHGINYLALGVNVVFHPVLLFAGRTHRADEAHDLRAAVGAVDVAHHLHLPAPDAGADVVQPGRSHTYARCHF